MGLRLILAVVIAGCGAEPNGAGGGAGGGGAGGGFGGSGGVAGAGGNDGSIGLGLSVEANGVPIGYAVEFDLYAVTVFQPDTRYLFRIDTATGFLAQPEPDLLPADFLSTEPDCSTRFYSLYGNPCDGGEEPVFRPVWPVDEDPVLPPGGAVGLHPEPQMREMVAETSRTGSSCTPRTPSTVCVLATMPITDLPTHFTLPIRLVP